MRFDAAEVVTDFFQNHSVLFALLCAASASAWAGSADGRLLELPAGTERMQEIARAVQEGALRTSAAST